MTIAEHIKAGAKIADVRTPEEFKGGAYPNAVNIPLAALPARMNELPKDKPIVVYCHSGGRSSQAERLLKQSGFSRLVDGRQPVSGAALP